MSVEILLFTRQHRDINNILSRTLTEAGLDQSEFQHYLRTLRHPYTEQNGRTYQSDFYVGIFSQNMFKILEKAGYTKARDAGGIDGVRLSKYDFSKVRTPGEDRTTNMVIHFDEAFDYRIKEWLFRSVEHQLHQLHRLGYFNEMPKVHARRHPHCKEITSDSRFIKIFFDESEDPNHVLFVYTLLSNTPLTRPYELRQDKSVSSYPVVLANNLRVAWMIKKSTNGNVSASVDDTPAYSSDEEN